MQGMSIAAFEESAHGPRYTPDDEPDLKPAREPIFNNGAWPVLLLAGLILAAYALQSRLLPPPFDEVLAFRPHDVIDGHAWTLLTSMFAHGNWAHAGMNAAFILAFGTPVARFFGVRGAGPWIFYGFYLLCGVVACLGFAALHWGAVAGLIGASGAASGLMGAAARLIGGEGRPGKVFSRAVLSMGAAWLIVNLIMAAVGAAVIPGAGDAAIGWEAHLAGFAAGVLLLGPFARLARRG